MKATLTFSLPDELSEFEMAQKGQDYAIALSDIRDLIRSMRKYRELAPEAREVLDELWKELHDQLAERHLDLAS